jgi:acyl-CoA thioesterase-1
MNARPLGWILAGFSLAAFVLLQTPSGQEDLSDRLSNPAMIPIVDNPGLPRVLLIGDSISIGYTTPVRKLLAGQANVHRVPANGGSTTNGLAHLDEWLGTSRWDVIHFNWGLHDLIVLDGGEHTVPIASYEQNLEKLVIRLKQTGAELIWASTTPVPEGKLDPPRRAGDEVTYNEAARRVMRAHGVAINDLHTFSAARLAQIQMPANVHFTLAGSTALAEPVAEIIQTALARQVR